MAEVAKVRGADRVGRTMHAAAAELERMADATAEYGKVLAGAAQGFAPVRTGRLRASIHADPPRFVSPMLVSAPVTASAPYARYVHEGTRPHVIRARRGGALRFHWDKVGREVFFASVQHPGSRANPFMMTAARRVAARQH